MKNKIRWLFLVIAVTYGPKVKGAGFIDEELKVVKTMEYDQNIKPFIFSVSGTSLLPEEQAFFEAVQPLGFILFKRNCENPEQIRVLVTQLKQTVKHKDVPILIDQEGGRVRRLRPPHFREAPPAQVFGDIYEINPVEAKNLAFENFSLLAQELRSIGVNVNCAPCSDLIIEGAHSIIGDRAFSSKPEVVADLSTTVIASQYVSGVASVIKHLPGHGRSMADSHDALPVVKTNLNTLMISDFSAFQKTLAPLEQQPWGMTAHVVYEAIDAHYCATESNIVINEIIRGTIGFHGFLVSDCLTMNALSGTYAERAQRALAAGCDAVLFCNGVLDDMQQIVIDMPDISQESMQRFKLSWPNLNQEELALGADFGVKCDEWNQKLQQFGIDSSATQISSIGEHKIKK